LPDTLSTSRWARPWSLSWSRTVPASTISVVIVAGARGIAAATPLAILGAIGRAAKHGAIIKGGIYLEALGQFDTVFFDKTGTLTLGTPTVAGVEPDISIENAQLIDSVNAWIGMTSKIAKSTVRSLYGDFPELPELPKLHLQTPPTLAKEHSEVPS
jgi:cation transport ATPase